MLCADEPYITDDFASTAEALQAAVKASTSLPVHATLLPVRTVGVQGDGRTYSYLAALSLPNEPNDAWPELLALAKLLPGLVHKVRRRPEHTPRSATSRRKREHTPRSATAQSKRRTLPLTRCFPYSPLDATSPHEYAHSCPLRYWCVVNRSTELSS